ANAAMKEIRRFIPQFVDLSEIAAEAFGLAREMDHSVYDCCYLALALRRGATVVTLDRQFIAGVAKSGRARSVLHLAEWSANG
ncbi:MAG TPA: type II toxin-antitoxin system VapC family toxin, partial [Roseiarcus sp.]|nr:type II toxin-antitoxin system VapC family toxin [Roseiarcus sp.]